MTKYKDPQAHLPDDGHAYYLVTGGKAQEAVDAWLADCETVRKGAKKELNKIRRMLRKPFKGTDIQVKISGSVNLRPLSFSVIFIVKGVPAKAPKDAKDPWEARRSLKHKAQDAIREAVEKHPDFEKIFNLKELWKFDPWSSSDGGKHMALTADVKILRNNKVGRPVYDRVSKAFYADPPRRNWWGDYAEPRCQKGKTPGSKFKAFDDGRHPGLALLYVQLFRPIANGPWFVSQPSDEKTGIDVDLSSRLTGLKRLSMSQYWRVLENTACKK